MYDKNGLVDGIKYEKLVFSYGVELVKDLYEENAGLKARLAAIEERLGVSA